MYTNGSTKIIERYDASDLIGLKVVVHGAVKELVDENGERTIEVPDLPMLAASAVVARCLMPLRLKGRELKVMRRIAGWTAAELVYNMGENTPPETISRWENCKQTIGGYAEKVLRLTLCSHLKDQARGVAYSDGMIPNLRIVGPMQDREEYEVPAIEFVRARMRSDDSIVETYMEEKRAA
jgi:hypothetical protein